MPVISTCTRRQAPSSLLVAAATDAACVAALAIIATCHHLPSLLPADIIAGRRHSHSHDSGRDQVAASATMHVRTSACELLREMQEGRCGWVEVAGTQGEGAGEFARGAQRGLQRGKAAAGTSWRGAEDGPACDDAWLLRGVSAQENGEAVQQRRRRAGGRKWGHYTHEIGEKPRVVHRERPNRGTAVGASSTGGPHSRLIPHKRPVILKSRARSQVDKT